MAPSGGPPLPDGTAVATAGIQHLFQGLLDVLLRFWPYWLPWAVLLVALRLVVWWLTFRKDASEPVQLALFEWGWHKS